MSLTFTKLFSSITESTIWVAPDAHRLCWITLLAMADSRGRVFGSVPGLANRARVGVEDTRGAIEAFLGPDLDSRTKDNEGRRLEVIDGGWRLLNHAKYRAIRDEEAILEAKRKYINTRRAVEKLGVDNVDRRRHIAEAEAEAEAEALKDTQATPEREQTKVFSPEQPADDAKQKSYRIPNCPHQRIVGMYHDKLPTAPRVIVDDKTRAGYMQARWRQVCADGSLDLDQALEVFAMVFDSVASSAFLTGRTSSSQGRRPFVADLGWIVRPTNFTKIVEGKYK